MKKIIGKIGKISKIGNISKTGSLNGESVVKQVLFNVTKNIYIAVAIQYLIFILVEITDIVIESYYFNNDFYIFFYLRFFFSAFNFIVSVVVIISIIVYFVYKSRANGNKYIESRAFGTFERELTAIYIFWTAVLISVFIPRIIILMRNREKIGTFISTLIYVKMFIMISIYVNLLVVFIIKKQKSQKSE